MIIIDSSCWIEFFGDGNKAEYIEGIITKTDTILVPTIILTEVFKWIFRERDENAALIAISIMKLGKIIELTETIALDAAYYGNIYKLPLADSIIYTSTLHYRAKLISMDKHFKNLSNVDYIEKK